MRSAAWLLLAVTGTLALGEPPSPPAFAKPLVVTGTATGARIAFAADRATDVTVLIEDGQGRVVRHLAAGVLGTQAPAPLQPGLAQELAWDGKDDYGFQMSGVRLQAGAGSSLTPETRHLKPLRVRVGLGMGATFDRVLASDVQNIGGPRALAVGADGTLYVCASAGASLPNWSSERIVALDRDGRYRRTVLPWPADLSAADVAGYGVYDLDGRPAPLVKNIPQRRFHSGLAPRKGGMAVTPGGVILKLNDNATLQGIGTNGQSSLGADGGPRLLAVARPRLSRSFVCAASDGKRAFVTGLGENRPGKQPESVTYASVGVVKLPDRGPAEPFFGRPEEPGHDDAHLGDSPRGVAVDGKGLLFVADFKNDRVVVLREADGRFVGQFAVAKPDGLGVDPATGAVYVLSLTKGGGGELSRVDGWRDAKAGARLSVRPEGNPDFPPVMAVDASAKPVVIWLGTDGGRLLRIEDQGATLAEKAIGGSGQFGSLAFEGIEVDRYRADPDIYVRCAAGTFGGNGDYWRYSEGSDTWTRVNFPGSGGVGGTCIVPGPDGVIYAPAYPQHILRYTRDGKPAPWPEGNVGYPESAVGKDGKPVKADRRPNGIYGPVSMGYMTHTLGVRPSDGHFFFFDPGRPGDRPHKMLREYTPDGRLVSPDPILWKVSDNCVGPKFDLQGNLYVAEQVKPLDQPCPPELAAVVGKVEPSKTFFQDEPVKNAVCAMYGSIVKFTPKGGMFHFTGGQSGGGNPYPGEPKLDPSLRTETYASYSGFRLNPIQVTGAAWVRMGISHQCLHYCNCENVRFDVDAFGRVWYPDLGRFRVCVLDTQGNAITHFGVYGNADDGTGNAERGVRNSEQHPAGTSDAAPRLSFAWLIGVGVTDRYAYMGDSLNRRLLRAKILYAAEETVEVR